MARKQAQGQLNLRSRCTELSCLIASLCAMERKVDMGTEKASQRLSFEVANGGQQR